MTTIYSPWIPDDKIIDFNVSFWAGLVSNLITGVITGIIVGILLWNMQTRYQEKDIRLQSEKDYLSFLRKIKINLNKSPAVLISPHGSQWLSKNMQEALNLITESPIDFWEEHLNKKNQYRHISIIKEILDKHSKFVIVSSHLDTQIEQRLRNQFTGPNLNEQQTAFYGILNGFHIDSLKPYLMTLNEDRVKLHKSIIEERDFIQIADYIAARQDLINKINDLMKDTKEQTE